MSSITDECDKSMPPQNTETRRVLVAGGTGDSGRRLTESLLARGNDVTVTTRGNVEEACRSLPGGVSVIHANPVAEPDAFTETLQTLGHFDIVYDLLAAWLRDPRGVYIDGTETLLKSLPAGGRPPRFVFCSTTTVYGDRPGELLDETSQVVPHLSIGEIVIEAESIVRRYGAAGRCDPVLLRLPHIYGPGREPTIDLMRRGEFVILGDGSNPMHHLHVADFINALIRAGDPDVPGKEVINVVEDVAEPYRGYCDFVTDWCGRPRLPCIDFGEALSTGIVSRYLGPHHKSPTLLAELFKNLTCHATIRNDKMKRLLGLELKYPTFRDGLTEMMQGLGEPDRRGRAG